MTKLSSPHLDYLNSRPPGAAVAEALVDLLTHDHYLLEIDANERSITFRFALYLQARLPDWVVDCEYNRDGVDPKRLGHIALYPDAEDENAKTVFPDVIVHRRGTQENYLVIEFKKSTNWAGKELDIKKLMGYRHQLRYEHALFVELATDGRAEVSDLEWVLTDS